MAYDGGNFQMVTAKGQSPFAAGLEWLAGYAQDEAARYNQRSLDAINTFKAENANVYGDAYKQKVAAFANDPANWNAMKRFGNQLPQEQIETPELAFNRMQNQHKIEALERGKAPGANYADRIEYIRVMTGRQPLNAEIIQAIREDKTTPEEQKDSILVEMGLKPEANVVYRTDVGKLVSDLDRAYKVKRDSQAFAIAGERNDIQRGFLDNANAKLDFAKVKAWEGDKIAMARIAQIKDGMSKPHAEIFEQMVDGWGEIRTAKAVLEQQLASTRDEKVRSDLMERLRTANLQLEKYSSEMDDFVAMAKMGAGQPGMYPGYGGYAPQPQMPPPVIIMTPYGPQVQGGGQNPYFAKPGEAQAQPIQNEVPKPPEWQYQPTNNPWSIWPDGGMAGRVFPPLGMDPWGAMKEAYQKQQQSLKP